MSKYRIKETLNTGVVNDKGESIVSISKASQKPRLRWCVEQFVGEGDVQISQTLWFDELAHAKSMFETICPDVVWGNHEDLNVADNSIITKKGSIHSLSTKTCKCGGIATLHGTYEYGFFHKCLECGKEVE